MVAYHLTYKHFNNKAVAAVKEVIQFGFYKAEEQVKKTLLEDLNKKLSAIYSLEVIEIKYDSGLMGSGMFCSGQVHPLAAILNSPYLNREPSNPYVVLNKPSLITFLHEFWHYVTFKKGKNQSEERARGWSLSLFYQAVPRLFKQSVKKGLIMFMSEEDLK